MTAAHAEDLPLTFTPPSAFDYHGPPEHPEEEWDDLTEEESAQQRLISSGAFGSLTPQQLADLHSLDPSSRAALAHALQRMAGMLLTELPDAISGGLPTQARSHKWLH